MSLSSITNILLVINLLMKLKYTFGLYKLFKVTLFVLVGTRALNGM